MAITMGDQELTSAVYTSSVNALLQYLRPNRESAHRSDHFRVSASASIAPSGIITPSRRATAWLIVLASANALQRFWDGGLSSSTTAVTIASWPLWTQLLQLAMSILRDEGESLIQQGYVDRETSKERGGGGSASEHTAGTGAGAGAGDDSSFLLDALLTVLAYYQCHPSSDNEDDRRFSFSPAMLTESAYPVKFAVWVLQDFEALCRRSTAVGGGPSAVSEQRLSTLNDFLHSLATDRIDSLTSGAPLTTIAHWIEALGMVQRILQALLMEICQQLEAAIAGSVPHIGQLLHRLDLAHGSLASSLLITTVEKAVLWYEIHRDVTSRVTRLAWLRTWCPVLNQLSHLVDTIVRRVIGQSLPRLTQTMITTQATTTQSDSKRSSEGRVLMKDLQATAASSTVSIASYLATLRSTLHVVNRPLIAQLPRLETSVTQGWISLLAHDAIGREPQQKPQKPQQQQQQKQQVLEVFDVEQRLVAYQMVQILDKILPFAREKTTQKLNLSDVTRLQAEIQALPSITKASTSTSMSTSMSMGRMVVDTGSIVDPVMIQAYLSASLITLAIFPEVKSVESMNGAVAIGC